jgi:iron(III) transport system permease protein
LLSGLSTVASTQLITPPRVSSPFLRRFASRWSILAIVVALVVVMPSLAIVWTALFPAENIWPHLAATTLPIYLLNTAALMIGVGLGVLAIGTGGAWLVAMCRFPGQRFFEWALLLPLAMPAYVIAYVYTDLLEFAGPVQEFLRSLFGWQSKRDYWFPDIRTLSGAIVMMILVLYPYVYAMARTAFIEQSAGVLEVSRTLGRGPWRGFLEVALPLARPAIVIGLTLALMETLNDFGTIDYFAVRTLTAGIFDVWFGMGNVGGAAQIALVMLVLVVVLIIAERRSRRRQRFHHTSSRLRRFEGYKLRSWKGWLATALCSLPIILGFGLPAGRLSYYAIGQFDTAWSPAFIGLAGNSLLLATIAAVTATMLALAMAYAARLQPSRLVRGATRLATLGYAIPGAVLAVGVILPLAAFDNAVDSVLRGYFGISSGLLLSGTIIALIFAYSVRFMTAAHGAIESGLAKITPSMDMAARTLGKGPSKTLRLVHLPMLRGSLLTAMILVFVDTMKELPATLVLRPFNFDTLATYVYQFASDELLEQCALAALAIVVTGILPVIILSRTISNTGNGPVNIPHKY